MLFYLGGRETIQDTFLRDTALACHLNTPVNQIELAGRMRIRIDAHGTAQSQGTAMPAPIKIEPPRIGIDFNRDAMLGAGF